MTALNSAGMQMIGTRVLYWGFFVLCFSWQSAALRPLRERSSASWSDQQLLIRRDENDLAPYAAWNITGTYRGAWNFLEATNSSSRFPEFGKSKGGSILELVSNPTKITGVHYVQ